MKHKDMLTYQADLCRKIENGQARNNKLTADRDRLQDEMAFIIRIAKGGEMLTLSEMEARIEELTKFIDTEEKLLAYDDTGVEDYTALGDLYAMIDSFRDKARALLDRVGGGS